MRRLTTLAALLLSTSILPPLAYAADNGVQGPAAALERSFDAAIDPAEMGTLFKVMAVTSPDLPAPAGFAEAVNSGGE